MIKFNYKKILAFLISFAFFIPFLIYAESPVTTIKNPLGDNNKSVEALLLKIMDLVTKIGGIVVVFFIIYSGFKFVTAGESDSERSKAREIFYATVIGGAILLGAGIIANVIVNTIKATTGV